MLPKYCRTIKTLLKNISIKKGLLVMKFDGTFCAYFHVIYKEVSSCIFYDQYWIAISTFPPLSVCPLCIFSDSHMR